MNTFDHEVCGLSWANHQVLGGSQSTFYPVLVSGNNQNQAKPCSDLIFLNKTAARKTVVINTTIEILIQRTSGFAFIWQFLRRFIVHIFIPFSGLSSHSYHQMKCCGWTGPGNWSENIVIKNSSQNLYSCSCRNESLPGSDIKYVGLCEHLSTELPIYETVCHAKICTDPKTQFEVNISNSVNFFLC